MERQLEMLSREPASTVEFVCCGAERGVQVAGSWNQWRARDLDLVGDDTWMLSLSIPPGTFQYKYIIDGVWIHDPSKKWLQDAQGNTNNVIKVESKLEVVIRNLRILELQKLVGRLKKTQAEIKELKQWLGTPWYSEVEKLKLDPKAGV